MSAALILVTHSNIASNMLQTAHDIVNHKTENFSFIEIPMDAPIEEMQNKIEAELKKLDTHHGALILTDIYGSTPSNIACQFKNNKSTRLVSGLNLPMLLKIINYRSLPLEELAEKAVEGGRDGIALYV